MGLINNPRSPNLRYVYNQLCTRHPITKGFRRVLLFTYGHQVRLILLDEDGFSVASTYVSRKTLRELTPEKALEFVETELAIARVIG